MNEHVNWFTVLLNKWLGGAALALLSALHITPSNPALPIPNYVAMDIVVFFAGVLFFLWLKPRISADRPGATQQAMEFLLTNPMRVGIRDILEDSVEHEPLRYVNMVGAIAIFILLANMSAFRRLSIRRRAIPRCLWLAPFSLSFPTIGGGCATRAGWIREDIRRAGLVAFVAAFPRRDYQQFCASAFAHRPSVGQYFRK